MKLSPRIQRVVNILARLLTPDERRMASTVYAQLMAQARSPWLYEKAKVPDTVDGRFEMLILHLFLLLRRLRDRARYEEEFAGFTEAIMELLFDDMDQSLREQGVGDISVGRKVRAISEAVYGRFNAYEEAVEEGVEAVQEAFIRNVYGTLAPEDIDPAAVDRLQAYFGEYAQFLASHPEGNLTSGLFDVVEPAALLKGKV
jgi:cytochrome b pre-mRNA-processing protein 3